jgi:hypothetical protein
MKKLSLLVTFLLSFFSFLNATAANEEESLTCQMMEKYLPVSWDMTFRRT